MASSLAMNGTSLRSPSSLSEGSEESFVVLSRCLDSESSEACSLMSSSIVCPTIPNVPVTDAVSQATSIMSTSVTSELSAEEIQSKLESLLQENLQLKATLQQNNLAMKKQFSTLVMWQEDVMKVHQSHKEKFEETKKLISNLRAENAELKKSTSLPCTTSSSSSSSSDTLSLQSKISALEFELDTLRQANIRFKNDQNKIIQELELRLSESEKCRDEESNKFKIQVEGLETQLHSAQEKCKEVQQKLEETLAKVPSQAEVDSNENMKKQLKDLATELVFKNKVLKEKTDLIDNLHEEISQLKIDNETIPILKTQVDLYQSDFSQEREARNSLNTEKHKIAEDLRHLQRRNQKLLEEVERLRRDDGRFVQVQMSQVPQAATQSPPRDTSPPLSQYICPVCSSRFRTLKLLEDHVDMCLQHAA